MEFSCKRKQSILIVYIFTISTIRVSTTTSDIIENMDSTADPCDNFYKFACGNFERKRVLPEDQSMISNLHEVNVKLRKQKKEMLERPLSGTEPVFFKALKNTYDSCMNMEKREEIGSKPLKELLKSLGGWPVLEGVNWDSSKFDWLETIIKAKNIGTTYGSLISIGPTTDFKNTKNRIIMVDQPILGMPNRDYLLHGLSDKATEAYHSLMVKSAKKLGANLENSEKELMDAFNFEIELANISIPSEERRHANAFYNLYTIKGLEELAPKVNWLKLINGILIESVSEQEKIVVSSSKLMKDLSELISRTDKRTLANYMMWRVVQSSLPQLTKEWKNLLQEYETHITGKSKLQPDSEVCIEFLSEMLPIAMSSYYVKNYFKSEGRDKVHDILKYIRNEFHDMLKNLDWMDEGTRSKALDKANDISPFIGYPEELLNNELVSEHHKNLSTSPDSYFNNSLNVEKWFNDKEISKLRQLRIKGHWKEHSNVATANAVYNVNENSIDCPAGILQTPFFYKNSPYFMNFAQIGQLLGHEIAHAFDDTGREYDKEGNNINWWNESTDREFNKRAKCIVNQYDNYTTETGLKLNGNITLDENIADIGGLKAAYRAYQTWGKTNGPEKQLPGLNYTTNQLFWIAAANIWCSKSKPEYLKLQILTDYHSPHPFRVIGPMSNLAEFSRDFNCPLGSGMNSKNKCEVW